MDFDDVENPERARKEALTAIKNVMDRFNIKEQDISVCFSGNKGFHVFVNHAVLVIEPYYYFPQIFKSIAKELIQQHKLKTLDRKIYDRRRLIRLPNTRHEKTGLYKIPLTLSELQNLSIDQIRALAIKPREHVASRIEHEPSEKATQWFKQHRDAYMKALEEKKPELSGNDFQIKDVLPCIKKRLTLGAEEGLRNRFTWQLESYFCKKGTSLEQCLEVMRQWYGKIAQGLEPYTWEECETTIRATYEKGGDSIGCGSEYVEGLCVGKENCPLFVKCEETEISEEAFKEAEEILLKNPRIHCRHCELNSCWRPRNNPNRVYFRLDCSTRSKCSFMAHCNKCVSFESFLLCEKIRRR